MSTRSATIIKQTTYWGEQAETEELMRFYRHCDGYPEGHGMDMAEAVIEADGMGIDIRAWCQPFLAKFLGKPCTVEFEPKGCQHGDLEYPLRPTQKRSDELERAWRVVRGCNGRQGDTRAGVRDSGGR